MSRAIENCKLNRVFITLKGASNLEFCIEALCIRFVCFPIKNQNINIVQNSYDHFKNLQLAESGFNCDIELLIGSDFCWSVVTGNVKIGKTREVVSVETKFGWLFNGPVTKRENISTCLSFVNENTSHILFSKTDQFTKTADLENELYHFWDLETLGISKQENHI